MREKHRSEGRSHLTHCIVILCTTYIIRGYIHELGLLEEYRVQQTVCVCIYTVTAICSPIGCCSQFHTLARLQCIYTRGARSRRGEQSLAAVGELHFSQHRERGKGGEGGL